MRVIDPISEAQRLLPRPASPAAKSDPVPVVKRPVRKSRSSPPAPHTAASSLSRETAAMAVLIQMLIPPRRGLKADPGERARFVRAYAEQPDYPAGMALRRRA